MSSLRTGGRGAVLRVVTEPEAGSAGELTEPEATALASYEETIAGGLASFMRVGLALAAIRDQRLYRVTHRGFEEYARERWGLGRAHAYRHIQAAQLAHVVSPVGDTPPGESVLRELGPLREDIDAVQKAWRTACERYGNRPTATQVRQVVSDIAPASPRRDGDGERRLRNLSATVKANIGSLQSLDAAALDRLAPATRRELARSLRPFAGELIRIIKYLEHDS